MADDSGMRHRGRRKQVRDKNACLQPYHFPSFFTQVVATIIVSLWHLIEGACVSILSTVIYSAEKESKVSLDEGTLARELSKLRI